MATIHERIMTTLTAAGVAQLYPDQAPDGVTPDYVVYFSVASSPENTLAGLIPIENSRFQFDCWSLTRLASRTLATLISNTLTAQRADPAQAGSFGATLLSDQDDYDPDTKQYRTILDMSLWYYGDVL
jgi:preprotein translocase subunit Sec61beta